jgi:hypothetical protein
MSGSEKEIVKRSRSDDFRLPPLILHPFSDANGPSRLVESSRASLMLQGLLPTGEFTRDELDRRLLDGRYCELRMVYYVGRDVMRWLEQCVDVATRHPEEFPEGVDLHSFAACLVTNPPDSVRQKLGRWGVADYRSIFSRGIALNVMFADAPPRHILADDFVRNYHHFADQIFGSFQRQTQFAELQAESYEFDLFASSEYSRMLERSWGEQAAG